MANANLIENDQVCEGLSLAYADGEGGLSSVPGLVKRVIREDMWRRRLLRRTGEVVEFERFIDFVVTKPLEGLGADIRMLERMCSDDPEAMTLLDAVLGADSVQGGSARYIVVDLDDLHTTARKLAQALPASAVVSLAAELAQTLPPSAVVDELIYVLADIVIDGE